MTTTAKFSFLHLPHWLRVALVKLVLATAVHWIEARGNYVHLHTDEGTFLLRETLTALAAELPAARFVRVHRSAVVAWPEVVAMQRVASGDHELQLRSGARVPLARTHRDAFVARWRGAR
jgi:two-component system LytT family response regulator